MPSMRAVRYHGPGDVRVEEIEEPRCGVGEVKIRPAFVGICGSDLHEYFHGPLTIPRAKIPITLGHEFSGTITEIGAGVTLAKVGDRVAVKPNLVDGGCVACLRGWSNCCRNLGFVGFSGDAGGMSDFVVVREEQAILLPAGFALDLGALVEPLTVAWHAVNRCSLRDARTVLVVGGGPIGLAVLLVLKARRVETVVVAEISVQRRELARTLGATCVIDPQTEDVNSKVRGMTMGMGADVAFECSGAQAGLDTAVTGIRERGTVTIVSLFVERPSVNALGVVLGEKSVMGAVIYEDGDFEAVIEAIWSGKLDPKALITSKIRMEDIVERGFQALVKGKDQHVKILVDIAA
ncbi:GroES-like protein [Aspergillus heteromorphus CBS 117.55]|uniref:GroES-like protein n=1 Tax=Aspergillus heteromorphus CBS 117.55 TaxID=1448321 RepID=A0A317WW21_9EURO|nr:GroES-like protein [Aspergillus heteromorphus CBS 117.55]PWY89008.1 GroES-like protein [Aspergillus heteromorphus CBS 117.55]